MRTISTIGYEGSDIEAFVNTLIDNNIDLILDIREIPLSRKKGFSKNLLRERLETNGIGYRHEKDLGSPKPIREKLYKDKNYEDFFRSFDKHLETQSNLISGLCKDLKGNVALLCFEKDVLTCHRKSVAREMSAILGRKPRHLVVQAKSKENGKSKDLHIGKSLSPA